MARKLWLLFVVLFGAAPAGAGPLRIGVALEWFREQTGSSVAALIELELPLERWAAPPRQAFADSPTSEVLPRAAPPAAAGAEPSLPAPPPPKPSPGPLLEPRLVRDVVAAALRTSRASTTEARLDGLSARARAASALPELVLRAARSTDQSLRLAPSDTPTLEVTQTGGADLLLEARATWRLDRLVFADEELRVEALRSERAQKRDRLVELVLERLFAWQRATAKLALGELDPEARLLLELERTEAELALDVLTAGFFGERRFRRARAEPPVSPER